MLVLYRARTHTHNILSLEVFSSRKKSCVVSWLAAICVLHMACTLFLKNQFQCKPRRKRRKKTDRRKISLVEKKWNWLNEKIKTNEQTQKKKYSENSKYVQNWPHGQRAIEIVGIKIAILHNILYIRPTTLKYPSYTHPISMINNENPIQNKLHSIQYLFYLIATCRSSEKQKRKDEMLCNRRELALSIYDWILYYGD